jgi:type II secretory ATPase GspE/PulE/Tfp pilus assembly ATPase PilB-like protein
VVVRFRQDGVLRKTVTLPKDLRSSVVSRIKIMANMKIDEQRLPQDGRFSIDVDKRKVDFRVSSMPVANGEKVVMRVLDKLTGILSIEELGITGGGLERLLNNLKKSHGMILVTGPTGSGKTTSLYALIDKLYTEGVNIVTLEDPIEYRMPGINQSQVNADIKYTFASGLRSIVRQDPDIIMIGEIRDSETAEMAVHAALTGHIVLSTLHTNDSAGAAPRLLDMGVEPFLLTSSLNIVIAQRLARKICQDCKEEFSVPEPEMEKVKAEIAKMPEAERPSDESLKFYHGKGCKNCNDSGYTGRIGLYEVLEITEQLKELILKKESSYKIQELAIKEGMITMLGDGILKAISGKTTLEEVWRITQE